MGVIGIGVGDCTLGRRNIGPDGKVASAKWEPSESGGAVCIWPIDPETMEPNGAAEVYGDWDAAQYLARVVQLIRPNRKINIPDLEAMIRGAAKDGFDICDYCPDLNCWNCVVKEWKNDPGGE